MTKNYFITATGTGIGKTYITIALIKQARRVGKSVAAYKPVISGFDAQNVADSDTGVVLAALGLPATAENIAQLSPWRYGAPLAPSMAARMENRPVDFDAVVNHSRAVMQSPSDIVLIEGAGGVMAPLTDSHTMLDWIARAEISALLIVGTYLGTISHTLTALEVLTSRRIPLAGIIVNESSDASVSLPDTVEEIKSWAKSAPVIGVKRDSDGSELKPLLI